MTERPRLLDLFCGAGGCSTGYHRAGFNVVGVDNRPMKNYPFEFHQADALEYLAAHGSEFDAIHASPPCQRYSVATKSIKGLSETHPDLVPPTRAAIAKTGLPYVIENVVGAPLERPLLLCGSMFDLLVQRHRLFESSILLLSPGQCRHGRFVGSYPCGKTYRADRTDARAKRNGERSKVVQINGMGGHKGSLSLWREAMGIDWMNRKELSQAIPPAYTEFIGRQLLASCLSGVN